MEQHILREPARHVGSTENSAVVVAVLTYRRNACLTTILPALMNQAKTINPPASVLVVDNDPAAGAHEIIESQRDAHLHYVHEPRPGIAAARNRALDTAFASGADALVFIDDDELPGQTWLQEHFRAWQAWKCAAVAGPVDSLFDRNAHPWIAASGAFDRRRHGNGDTVSGAATHNLLLDLAWVSRLQMRFDERLGLTGGEDTMFSHQLIDRGGTIRWCEHAEVVEPVPPDRLRRRWVLRRAYRAGTSWSRMELALARSRTARTRTRSSQVARGVLKLGWGLAVLATGMITGDVRRRARGAVTAASYAGLLTGSAGLSLREYRRPA